MDNHHQLLGAAGDCPAHALGPADLYALGGIAVFLIGTALLLEDGRALFAPVFGIVGGIAAVASANHERLRERVEALEKRLAQQEWRNGIKAPWNR